MVMLMGSAERKELDIFFSLSRICIVNLSVVVSLNVKKILGLSSTCVDFAT